MKQVLLCVFFLFFNTYSHGIELSGELVQWSHANPIVLLGTDSKFPPYDFIDEHGNPAGIGELTRQRLSPLLPVNLSVVSSTSFNQEYNKLKMGEIDAIVMCAHAESRKEEVLFSKPLFTLAPILVINSRKTKIKTEDDIKKHHRIGANTGDSTIEYAIENKEKADFISIDSNLEGYKKVENGELDGFITYLYVYKYLAKKEGFKNLSPVPIHREKGNDIGFCVNKSKPELVEIINWGLDQLGSDFIHDLHEESDKETLTNTQITDDIEQKSNPTEVIIYTLLTVISIIGVVLIITQKFAGDIAEKFDTRKFRVSFYFILSVIIFFIFIAINIYLKEFKEQVLLDQKESFEVTQNVTKTSLDDWYYPRKQLTTEIAAMPYFRKLTTQLVTAHENKNSELLVQVKKQLKAFFDERPSTTLNRRAYTIIDTKGVFLLNMVTIAENRLGAMKREYTPLFERVLSGETQFVPPVWSDVDIDGNKTDKDAETFVATPIKNSAGKIIAVFAMRFDTLGQYFHIFNDARLGETFESYAVNTNGYMVSESRFTDKLQQKGILPFGQSSILNIKLPGAEISPIVDAVQFKLAGKNFDGYQNYMGEIVVGQWIWLKEYNFSIVSEINIDEMFAEYYDMRKVLYLGTITACSVFIALSIFMFSIARRANEINSRSKDELAELVEERTKELALSEGKSKLIYNSVADGILGVDDENRLAFLNPAGAQILGVKQEQFVGKSMTSLFMKQDFTQYTEEEAKNSAIYKAVMHDKQKKLHIDHKDVYLFDGRTIPLEYSASSVESDESSLSVVIVFKDITERLIENERVDKILNAAPACMMIVNQLDVIESVNKTGLNMLGYDKDDIVGHPLTKIIPEHRREDHIQWTKAYWKNPILHHSGMDEQKLDIQGRDNVFFAESIYTPVEFSSGLMIVVMLRDITKDNEVKKALVEARQIADDASKAKSDFLANMSHEIRTPMNAIMGMSHLALGCELERKPRNYISKVSKAAESLLGIINDILDFSKIEAGKLDLEKVEFNLHDNLDNLSNIIGHKSYEKGIELLFDIAPDVPIMLIGDPLRLNQVLINIAGNAVKFTEKGEVVIAVNVEEVNGNNIGLLFSVKDSGIGMSEQQKQKLFKSFSQADSSITRKYGGTGLGLTISKKLVELMGGTIWLESEEGVGSNFFFTSEFTIAENANARFKAQQKTFLTNKRILIVDDNIIALDVLKSILLSFGCKVITAQSGEEAIETTKQSTLSFDLFIIDWKMAGLDGVQTINSIKEQHDYPSKDFILVTSNARDDVIFDELKSSVVSVIKKPITASSLFDEVMRLHGKKVIAITRKVSKDSTLKSNQALLAGSNILLVEDNELNQELALELLKQANIVTDLAINGQQAVEKVMSKEYDGVLMDLQMPVMDGFTATEIIRKDFPTLPIIAMTANAMAGDKEKVIAVGMNDHITKPINVSDMFNTMVKWIQPATHTPEAHKKLSENIDKASVESSENSLEGTLPEFHYINSHAGLAVSNGNISLYNKLLGKFTKGHRDFTETFEQHLQDNLMDDATRLAHTLKGSAGNIGAQRLLEKAQKLESACLKTEKLTNLNKILLEVSEEHTAVLQELDVYLSKKSDTSVKSKTKYVFSEAMKSSLMELLELVEDFETSAIEVADVIQEELNGSDQALVFNDIHEKIEAYNFTEAEEKLTRFINNIE